MALIAIPFEDQPDQTRVVRSGDAAGMRRNIERVLASFPADFLADAQLTGAAAGAVWQCALTFTGDPTSVTPLAPTGSILVRVVVAGDAPAVEALLAVAELELQAAGAMWIAKVILAGGGAGAVWMAVILASTTTRPTPEDCNCPLLVTRNADNDGNTIDIEDDVTPSTLLATTGPPLGTLAGQKLLVWARVLFKKTGTTTIGANPRALIRVVATPTIGAPIVIDDAGATIEEFTSELTITLAGVEVTLPPDAGYTFTLLASVTGFSPLSVVVEGAPPAAVPGAALAVMLVNM